MTFKLLVTLKQHRLTIGLRVHPPTTSEADATHTTGTSWLNELVRYGSCTYREIAELAANGAIAVVPLGPTSEHRGFGAGFLDLPAELHEAVVRAVVESLVAQGFRDVVVWQGCGQHKLRGAAEALNAAHAPARVHLPDPPFHAIWCEVADPTVPGGHADSFTTSIMLARRPELVRHTLIPKPSRSPDWSEENLDFAAYSDSGVIGDPDHASAAIGERLWQACTGWVARYLRDSVAPGDDSSGRVR